VSVVRCVERASLMQFCFRGCFGDCSSFEMERGGGSLGVVAGCARWDVVLGGVRLCRGVRVLV